MLDTLALTFGSAAGTCVALLLLVGSVAKLRHRVELPAVIANYRLLPQPAVRPVALLLPWAEGAIGLALLAGERVAAVAAMLLLLLFAGAMSANIRRGRSHIDCGCGIGGLHQPLHHALVRRNLMLAAALLPLALMPARLAPIDHVVAVATGIAAFVLVHLLDALLALPSTRPLTA